MNRYVLVVRRWWAVPLAVTALVLSCGAAGTSEVPVPSLVSGMIGARVAYFTPLLVVGAVMYCLDRRAREPERTAVVPIRRYDAGAVVLTVVLAHAAGLLVGMDVARNVTLLLALALLVRRLANEATAVASGLLFLLLNLILGRTLQPEGHASHTWWAVALHPAGSVTAWLGTAVLFALALRLSESRRAR
ncbi:hypothetical protein ACF064_30235 [Streptomyces sp. NPDC015492]|uniref:hypothetical protein n=1 Tax=Streptomyces sp. NPDC015492 TaxID=3364958 RepID=UPI0036F50149